MSNFVDAILFYAKMGWWIYLVFAIAGIGCSLFLFSNFTRMKKYGKDILVREYCRRKRVTLGRIVEKDGHEVEFPCLQSREDPGIVNLKDKNLSKVYQNYSLVSPEMINSTHKNYLWNGVPVCNYLIPYSIPMSFMEIKAMVDTILHIRQEHKELNFINDDPEIMLLIFSHGEALKWDSEMIISKYSGVESAIPNEFFDNAKSQNKKDLDKAAANSLQRVIVEIQREMKTTRVKPGIVPLTKAGEINNLGIVSQEMTHIISLVKSKMRNSLEDPRLMQIGTFVVLGLLVIGGITLCMWFLSNNMGGV